VSAWGDEGSRIEGALAVDNVGRIFADVSGSAGSSTITVDSSADAAGPIIQERESPHDSFAGHTLQTQWDQLHRLYFTSYAMWNYLKYALRFRATGLRHPRNRYA